MPPFVVKCSAQAPPVPVALQPARTVPRSDVDGAAAAIESKGGAIVKGPYDDAHERRVVVYDAQGNPLVFYSPLGT